MIRKKKESEYGIPELGVHIGNPIVGGKFFQKPFP